MALLRFGFGISGGPSGLTFSVFSSYLRLEDSNLASSVLTKFEVSGVYIVFMADKYWEINGME